jgi:hypothetical protein
MVKSQENKDYEQVVEKIVFDEEELEELKVVIKKFAEGRIQIKELKQKFLQCRGRIVRDISNFLNFCVDRIRNDQFSDDQKVAIEDQSSHINAKLQQDIEDREELLKDVAEKVNEIVSNIKKIH